MACAAKWIKMEPLVTTSQWIDCVVRSEATRTPGMSSEYDTIVLQ